MNPGKLTLNRYRELMGDLGSPDKEQQHDFVRYVANAHSWYKHLPLLGTGAPFYFFIDPVSGLDRYRSESGIGFREKPRGAHFFHYNEMPTYDYRRRFGWLSYACDRGTQIFYRTLGGVSDNNQTNPVIHSIDGQAHQIPDEALEAGRIELTGAIHVTTDSFWLGRFLDHIPPEELPGFFPDDPELPAEWLNPEPHRTELDWNRLNERIDTFIARERERQLQAMEETIAAVVQVAFGVT